MVNVKVWAPAMPSYAYDISQSHVTVDIEIYDFCMEFLIF